MLQFSDKNITYDANGNMTSVTNSCGTTTYAWDARNRLVGINGFDAQCDALSVTFSYDALGRRTGKTINGRTVQYLYDGDDIVQEIENGVVTVNYIRTLNIDEPLARIQSSGTVRYYQADALGSIIALTDQTGAIRTRYTYDPFGNVLVSGEPSDNPFQYTGRENDGTGLYYYRARYYSPELQRFISEDPIGFEGGDVNFYSYVHNDPVNYTDPLGLARDCDQEHIECFRRCWNQNPPWPIKRGSGGHYRYCQSKCLAQYMECRAEQCLEEFNEWMQEHYPQPNNGPVPGVPPPPPLPVPVP
jgi:RHS repeat-associated protein